MGSGKPLPCVVTCTFPLTPEWLFWGLRSGGKGCQDNSHLVRLGGISGGSFKVENAFWADQAGPETVGSNPVSGTYWFWDLDEALCAPRGARVHKGKC